jgi:hypothetical protein
LHQPKLPRVLVVYWLEGSRAVKWRREMWLRIEAEIVVMRRMEVVRRRKTPSLRVGWGQRDSSTLSWIAKLPVSLVCDACERHLVADGVSDWCVEVDVVV